MRRRLLGSYLTITAVTLLVLIYPLGRIFASHEQDRLLRDIEHDVAAVASLSEDSLERGARPELGGLFEAYTKDPGGRIVIVDRQGVVVADSGPDQTLGTSFANRPEIASAIGGERTEGRRYSETAQSDLVFVAAPVASGGRVHGAVRITYPSSTLDSRIRSAWLGLGLLSVVVVIVVTGVGLALTRLVTTPVERLEDAAHRIAGGDLSARAPVDKGAPELRELAAVFNESVQRQQDLLEAQRAFVGDASHQIRTPLAALRLQLENLESVAPLELQPAIATARSETARLGRISEGLLALTRATGNAAPCRAIDLASVIAERQVVWAPIAAEEAVAIECEHPDHLWVMTPPEALEQIIDNLVDNALDVSPPETTVTVSARPAGDRAELHVTDDGPGLSDEQRARAFDRFWRGPQARPGGTGLGLAIVAQLVAACGGTAELRSRPEGGLDAVITLRRAELPES